MEKKSKWGTAPIEEWMYPPNILLISGADTMETNIFESLFEKR